MEDIFIVNFGLIYRSIFNPLFILYIYNMAIIYIMVYPLYRLYYESVKTMDRIGRNYLWPSLSYYIIQKDGIYGIQGFHTQLDKFISLRRKAVFIHWEIVFMVSSILISSCKDQLWYHFSSFYTCINVYICIEEIHE